MPDPTKAYLKQIEAALAAGNATEHTHRPALKALIEALGPGITAVNEPKSIACGAPDFVVQRADLTGFGNLSGLFSVGYIYCVPKIEATINRLGGLDENTWAPRKFYELPEGSAQQLALFEQEPDYELDE